ncbi:MAG TPA: hypothetical protein VMT37_15375 [Solirubrobacterales bacterium]|nr:hypothetical protein [Solirubrobacterales bacterium]
MNMTLRFSLAAALGAVCLAVLAPSAFATTTYYAAPSGSGSECTEAAPCELKKAEEVGFTAGDKIVVEPGTYSLSVELAFRSVDVGGVPGQPVPVIQTNGHAVRAGVGAAPAFHDLRIEGSGFFGPREGSGERIFVSYTGNEDACNLLDGGVFRDVVCWAHGGHSGTHAIGLEADGETVEVSLRNVTAIDVDPGGSGLFGEGSAGGVLTVSATNVIARASQGKDITAEYEGFSGAHLTLHNSNYATIFEEEPPFTAITPPGTNGNQTASPLFLDAAAGNFAEASGSPTIDAGSDDPLNGATALAGEARTLPRCLGGVSVTDIGAYEFVPTQVCPTESSFKFGKLKLNKKKGTATLELKAPGAGTFTISGKGVKKVTRTVGEAASPKLTIKPVGKWKKKLEKSGGLKVKIKVKFEPNGNAPLTKGKKLTLRKTTG